MKNSKTYLKLLIVVGLVAVVGGSAGTFASFNAETTNAGNTFATGTLVLQNDVASSSCLSTGGGNTDTNTNSTNCGKVFDVDVQQPGDKSEVDLTLTNAGSLAASSLSVQAGTCVDSDAAAEGFHGTGNVCSALNLYIQEWDDAAHTTPTACWYGTTSATDTCDTAFTTGATLAAFGTGTHDISVGPAATGFAASGDPGDTRYFTIGVQLPSTANNTYQGRQAVASLSWKEAQ
jgi:predicted ribosomally synthesized peptide with SipW-like signal peptide